MAPLSFDVFRRDRIEALQRIARATPHHLKSDELLSEAWIAACDLGEKRAVSLDLTNLAEQELLLGCLYNRHVKFVRGKRFEESLDSELTNIKGAGAGETWCNRARYLRPSERDIWST